MEIEYRTVVAGSVLEGTPEGLHAMDTLRRRHEAEMAALPPAVRAAVEELDRRSERAIFGSA